MTLTLWIAHILACLVWIVAGLHIIITDRRQNKRFREFEAEQKAYSEQAKKTFLETMQRIHQEASEFLEDERSVQ